MNHSGRSMNNHLGTERTVERLPTGQSSRPLPPTIINPSSSNAARDGHFHHRTSITPNYPPYESNYGTPMEYWRNEQQGLRNLHNRTYVPAAAAPGSRARSEHSGTSSSAASTSKASEDDSSESHSDGQRNQERQVVLEADLDGLPHEHLLHFVCRHRETLFTAIFDVLTAEAASGFRDTDHERKTYSALVESRTRATLSKLGSRLQDGIRIEFITYLKGLGAEVLQRDPRELIVLILMNRQERKQKGPGQYQLVQSGAAHQGRFTNFYLRCLSCRGFYDTSTKWLTMERNGWKIWMLSARERERKGSKLCTCRPMHPAPQSQRVVSHSSGDRRQGPVRHMKNENTVMRDHMYAPGSGVHPMPAYGPGAMAGGNNADRSHHLQRPSELPPRYGGVHARSPHGNTQNDDGAIVRHHHHHHHHSYSGGQSEQIPFTQAANYANTTPSSSSGTKQFWPQAPPAPPHASGSGSPVSSNMQSYAPPQMDGYRYTPMQYSNSSPAPTSNHQMSPRMVLPGAMGGDAGGYVSYPIAYKSPTAGGGGNTANAGTSTHGLAPEEKLHSMPEFHSHGLGSAQAPPLPPGMSGDGMVSPTRSVGATNAGTAHGGNSGLGTARYALASSQDFDAMPGPSASKYRRISDGGNGASGGVASSMSGSTMPPSGGASGSSSYRELVEDLEQMYLSACEYGIYHRVVQLLGDSRFSVSCTDARLRDGLMKAASNGHENIIRLLLGDSRINPDRFDESGETALHKACGSGHDAVVNLLLDDGRINPNTRNKAGATPFLKAVRYGHDSIICIMLNHRAVNVSARDNNGSTALHVASQYRQEAVLNLLLLDGRVYPSLPDSQGRTCLHNAVIGSPNVRLLRLLLTDKRMDISVADNAGQTVLHYACVLGDEVIVRALLAHPNCNPAAVDSHGRHALHAAVHGNGRSHVVLRVLLEDGRADPSAFDRSGRNAFHHSASRGDCNMMSLLLQDRRMDASARDGSGNNALDISCMCGHLHGVVFLLPVIDPRSKDGHGLNCLHKLCLGQSSNDFENNTQRSRRENLDPISAEEDRSSKASEYEEILKHLLADGRVDPTQKDSWRQSPLLIAARNGFINFMKILLSDSRVDATDVDNLGENAIHKACYHGNVEPVSLLLQDGRINPHAKNANGATPFDVARRSKHITLMRWLASTLLGTKADSVGEEKLSNPPMIESKWTPRAASSSANTSQEATDSNNSASIESTESSSVGGNKRSHESLSETKEES